MDGWGKRRVVILFRAVNLGRGVEFNWIGFNGKDGNEKKHFINNRGTESSGGILIMAGGSAFVY